MDLHRNRNYQMRSGLPVGNVVKRLDAQPIAAKRYSLFGAKQIDQGFALNNISAVVIIIVLLIGLGFVVWGWSFKVQGCVVLGGSFRV